MADDNLFPIDESTASESKTTFNDAALLAQLAHVPNATGVVVQGLDFDVDLDAEPPLMAVSGGWARMYDTQGPTRDHTDADPPGPDAITVLDQTLPLQIGQRVGLELTSDDDNYVYLTGDRSGAEANGYDIQTTERDPDGLSLLVGTVDTSAASADEATTLLNRLPEGAFAAASVEAEPADPTDVARLADLPEGVGDKDIVNALDGATIAPEEVGTDDDPVGRIDTREAHIYGAYSSTTITRRAAQAALYPMQYPASIYAPSMQKTFITFRGDDADPHATVYDHQTRSFGAVVRMGANTLDNTDQHGPPSICILNDGRLLAFYGAHDDPFQLARTAAPYDIRDWEDLGEITGAPVGTYPSPAVLAGDVFLFYRSGSGESNNHGDTYPNHEFAGFARSHDGGGSWNDIGPLIDLSEYPAARADVYPAKLTPQNGNLHLSWTVAHGDQHDGDRDNAYHAIYDPDNNVIRAVDGTETTPPVTWSRLSQSAFEGFTGKNVGFVHHALDGDTIHLLHNWADADAGLIRKMHSWWDGVSWNNEQIANVTSSGENGFAAPRINARGNVEAHLSTGVTKDVTQFNSQNGNYEVWTKRNGGWQYETTVANTADVRTTRIQAVQDGTDEFPAIFVEETNDPTDWNLRLFGVGDVGNNAPAATQPHSKTLIQNGTVTQNGPPAASDGSWDTANGDTSEVVFEDEFSSIPHVVVSSNTAKSESGGGWRPVANNISTTGFTLVIQNYSTTDLSATTVAADWAAFGQ